MFMIWDTINKLALYIKTSDIWEYNLYSGEKWDEEEY